MDFVDVKLRIPKDVHSAVKINAADEGRTLTKQIIQLLKSNREIRDLMVKSDNGG